MAIMNCIQCGDGSWESKIDVYSKSGLLTEISHEWLHTWLISCLPVCRHQNLFHQEIGRLMETNHDYRLHVTISKITISMVFYNRLVGSFWTAVNNRNATSWHARPLMEKLFPSSFFPPSWVPVPPANTGIPLLTMMVPTRRFDLFEFACYCLLTSRGARVFNSPRRNSVRRDNERILWSH